MLREAIHHQAGANYAYPVAKDTLLLQVRTAKQDVRRVSVVYGSRYDVDEKEVVLEKYASDLLYDYYRAQVKERSKKFRYYFVIDDGREKLWYNELGLYTEPSRGFNGAYFHYPHIGESDLYEVPRWLDGAVVYQVFVDRFCKGNAEQKSIDVSPEGDMDFYGGDLPGIVQKLDYLNLLGVNVLYLSPIFDADTNHGYDTSNYYRINPRFGSQADFKHLVEQCHKRSMRVILDGVFHSCGYYSPYFQDVVEKGVKSEYWDMFYLYSYPVRRDPPNYDCFAGSWRLPKLRIGNAKVQALMLEIASYWTREFDIDGWRIDTANEVDHKFLREFRNRIKACKKDVYIVGEIWHNSIDFLQGDQLDGVMNYHLATTLFDFFYKRKLSVSEFDGQLTLNRISYPKKAVQAAWNVIESHDTHRILYSTDDNKAVLRLMFAMQMTYPGVPSIYFGTETGLKSGHESQFIRFPMNWDVEAWDKTLMAYIKKLISIRRQYRALRSGDIRTVSLDDEQEIYVYERFSAVEKAYVIINRSTAPQTVRLSYGDLGCRDPGALREVLHGLCVVPEADCLRLTIPPAEAAICV